MRLRNSGEPLNEQRKETEESIFKRLVFSRRFRRGMLGVAALSGAYLAATTNMDFSVELKDAKAPVEASAKNEDPKRDPSNAEVYGPFGIIITAGAGVAVEKRQTAKYINNKIKNYADVDHNQAGLSITLLSVDEANQDFDEHHIIDNDAINNQVSTGADWAGDGLKIIFGGVSTYGALEAYEVFATNQNYYNEAGQVFFAGLIAGMYVVTQAIGNSEDRRWEVARQRLDNIDKGLGTI